MGKPPAVIIVARHGARLDAADKQWHLTSPTPYDPPLTYGGWRQSHALGARIANIIHSREVAAELPPAALKHSTTNPLDGYGRNSDGHGGHGVQSLEHRKHRVIIHSSPFLRCLQTSVALSAGLVETQASLRAAGNANGKSNPTHAPHAMHSGSPHIRAMDHLNSPVLSAISEPEEFEDQYSPSIEANPREYPKPCMRIDAFLGEWLSPGYFEDITHPPDSVMMMAGAKANLLKEKPHGNQVSSPKKTASGNFPGGWGGGLMDAVTSTQNDSEGPLTRMSGLNRSLPRLNRSSSHSSAGSLAHRSFQGPLKELESASSADGYVSPIPSYAISPSAPIPLGYVSHAKEACLDIDYKWDSVRPPQQWPDGGQFGEEWISMHRRFRRGLQQMILWYQQANTRPSVAIDEGQADFSSPDGETDEDIDTVLVLVTHSAGCNALIGALTNQPVLLDAGMASLTMAVRRPNTNSMKSRSPEPKSPTSRRRRSSIYVGISEDYEVKIMASTEHLRGGSTTPSRRSTSISSSHIPERYRSASLASTSSSFSSVDGGFTSESEGFNGASALQRSASAATPRSNGLWSKPVPVPSSGLWSKPATAASQPTAEQKPVHKESPLRESLTSRDINTIEPPAKPEPKPAEGENEGPPNNGGLWGAPPAKAPSERERGPKRRWTHHHHEHH